MLYTDSMVTIFPQRAGTWYPSDAHQLIELFEARLQSLVALETLSPVFGQKTMKKRSARVLVLPHAGLHYSSRGQVASLNYLPMNTKSLLILSPSHWAKLPSNKFCWAEVSTWETPLGHLPGLEMHHLKKHSEFVESSDIIQQEHGIEMLLPALSWKTQGWESKPQVGALVCPSPSNPQTIRELANILRDQVIPNLPEPWVLLVSSDFCHYGPRFGFTPWGTFSQPATREKVREEDLAIARLSCEGRYEQILEHLPLPTMPTICGVVPLLLSLLAMEEVTIEGKILDYYHSDLGGRDENAVAYCSLVFSYTRESPGELHEP